MEESRLGIAGAGIEYPRPIDHDGYFGILGDIARMLKPYTEADPNALIVQAGVCFGNLIGRRAYYMVGTASRHYPNEFAAVIGKTAKARKGTSLQDVREYPSSLDPTWKAAGVATVLSSGEGLVNLARDPLDEEDAGVVDKRILMAVHEFSTVFKAASRTGNNLVELVCQAWDGHDLRIATKKPLIATAPHISIIGHVTHAALLDAVKGSNLTHLYNGFANRFLFACATRSQKKARLTDYELARLKEERADLEKRIQPLTGFINGLDEVRIRFDDEAGQHFDQWYLDEPDGADLLSAVTDRAEAHVCRLAIIEAVLDKSTVIRMDHLRAALAIWRYCRDSAEYVFSQIIPQSSPVERMASTITKALDQHPDGLSKSDIYRDVFGSNKSSDLIDQALLRLEQEGLTGSVKDPGSRQPERWLKAKVALELASLAA